MQVKFQPNNAYFDSKDDQDGSDASVKVSINLSL